ncbi:hypothetical protein RJ641_000262 [Dillenia turbinata]|uniref:Uncharacterized protein n=1 Tax=Dillenia turbinata TaxID=194707 RepID=A0AAN8WBM1_9MAGN
MSLVFIKDDPKTEGREILPTQLWRVTEHLQRTYNNQGRVVRGPAPLSLALAHAVIDDGKVVFIPWVETDFRTGDAPWWA